MRAFTRSVSAYVAGLVTFLVGGAIRSVDDVKPSEAVSAPVEVIVDRISLDEGGRARLQEALEQAWSRSDGRAHVITDDDKVAKITRGLACPSCSRTFDPPRAGLFSYNNPAGACATCRGFGRTIGIDWHKVIPDHDKTLAQGAAPLPNVKLDTQLPTCGPVVMDNGGAFTMTIYGAALMQFSLQAKPGRLLDVTA